MSFSQRVVFSKLTIHHLAANNCPIIFIHFFFTTCYQSIRFLIFIILNSLIILATLTIVNIFNTWSKVSVLLKFIININYSTVTVGYFYSIGSMCHLFTCTHPFRNGLNSKYSMYDSVLLFDLFVSNFLFLFLYYVVFYIMSKLILI